MKFFTFFTVRPYRLASLLGIGVLTTGCGISATYNYPGTGLTHDLNEREVQLLGETSACQGAGCNSESSLSLTIAPPASNYQAALRKKAAKLYSVPESQVVLGEITVRFSCNELLGTIRGWQAQAIAGKKTLSGYGIDVPAQREVSKEFEGPMREPDDPRSGMIMPCRTPGCGPWKNAINHMHCAPGYDVY